MDINYLQDRKVVGYGAYHDILCGIELVRVSNNLCIAIKPLPCKVSRKRIAFIVAFVFITCCCCTIKKAEAIGLAPLSTSQ